MKIVGFISKQGGLNGKGSGVFMVEQISLHCQAQSIACKGAIAAYHPVTGHNDGYWIFAIGESHCARVLFCANNTNNT